LIAEIGVNYEGSMERAKAMIAQVARAGGHAAKFQTYKADTLAAKHTSPAYWDTSKEPTTSQHELFTRFDSFGPEEYQELAQYCKEQGIDFLSTPFDLDSVDYLAPLMPLIKVASADLTNIPLIRKGAQTGKPLLISVGASSHQEIQRAIREALDHGSERVSIMHCVLNYPTPKPNAQLGQIAVLQREFGDHVAIGYSDHVAPDADGSLPALEAASLYGARVIEKHFTDDRTQQGNDHYHSMDQASLARFVEQLASYRELHGTGSLNLESQSAAIQNARRRIIANRDILVGDVLQEADLIALRSNVGIEISHWDDVVGARAKHPVAKDAPISFGDLETR
jgi:sialic acid synthase SpsE